MTDSEKELVRRLREHKEPNATWHVDRDCTEAADAIERLARERDEARAERDTALKGDVLQMMRAQTKRAEAAEAEVARLTEILSLLGNSDDPHVRNSVLNFLEDRAALEVKHD